MAIFYNALQYPEVARNVYGTTMSIMPRDVLPYYVFVVQFAGDCGSVGLNREDGSRGGGGVSESSVSYQYGPGRFY